MTIAIIGGETVQDVFDYARKKSRVLNFSSPTHLAVLMFLTGR